MTGGRSPGTESIEREFDMTGTKSIEREFDITGAETIQRGYDMAGTESIEREFDITGTETIQRGYDMESSLSGGEHALSVQGDLRASRRRFDAAYREAERQGDGRAMARAALGLGGLWVHEHRKATEELLVQTRQRRALSLLDPRSSLALRLRARLAAESDYRADEHGTILAMVAEARRAGDPVALAEALSMAHHCVLGPGHETLRMELAQELIGEASRTGRRGDLLMGLLWRTVDLFLVADPHAERSLEELRGLLASEEHLAVGFVVSAIEVMLSIRAGRFEEAEKLATACAERGAAAGDVDVSGWFGCQMVAIRWYQGRIAELVPLMSELVNSPTLSTIDNSYLAGLAVGAASMGDRRRAEGALARLCGRDLADLPRSSSWLISMYGLVEAAHLLQDAGTSARAYALLAPFARLPVVASLGVACLGSVHHALGVASLTVGDAARAAEHLHAAVHHNLALGHWPATVLSRMRLGQALALRDGPQDAAALRELTLAEQEAAGFGMRLPLGGGSGSSPWPDAPFGAAPHSDAGRGAAPRSGPERPPAPASPSGEAGRRTAGAAACRRRGRQWQVELNGWTVVVADSVGMRHLAVLLANPGQEVPAIDLVAGLERSDAVAVQAAASAQPVLDEVARREYKQRLERLRDEIDKLESAGEWERAAACEAERDWLIAELAAATGLGGRLRSFTDSDERARIAAGKAIRRALARISEADPTVGEELRATVHTGFYCCYRPFDH